jgi:hypothetical protein
MGVEYPSMNRKLNLTWSLAAGISGGILSHYLPPVVAHAESQAPLLSEVRAQRFVLVDEKGLPRAVFAIEKTGFPTIEASAEDGHVYTLTRQVTRSAKEARDLRRDFKPSLLPIQP